MHFSNLFIVAVHYTHNTCYVLLQLLTVPMYTLWSLHNNLNILILLLWTPRVGSVTDYFKDLATALKNTANRCFGRISYFLL